MDFGELPDIGYQIDQDEEDDDEDDKSEERRG